MGSLLQFFEIALAKLLLQALNLSLQLSIFRYQRILIAFVLCGLSLYLEASLLNVLLKFSSLLLGLFGYGDVVLSILL